MKRTEGSCEFTHLEYRSAKVVHMVNKDQEVLFYHQGRPITKEEADAITQRHMEDKRNSKGNE